MGKRSAIMESGHLFFDPSACHENMLFLGTDVPICRGARSLMSTEETSKRRPFLSSPDDLFDDVYYDAQLPEKKRRLTPEQVQLMEKSFESENKLEMERKTQLAKNLGLKPRQVAVWFQNRRARWKTKQLERDYDVLKSSYDALLSNYEAVVKETEKLKLEVVSLREKLEAKEENKEPKSSKKNEPQPADTVNLSVLHFRTKTEDRLSSGSGTGSAVVDEDGTHLVVDSGESYFGCMGPVHTIQYEEDDGSDDGWSYFSNVLMTTADHVDQQHDEEPLAWWVWS